MMQYLTLPDEKHFHLKLLFLKQGHNTIKITVPIHVSSTPILKLSHPIQKDDQLIQVTTKLYPGVVIEEDSSYAPNLLVPIGEEGLAVECQCGIWLLEHEQTTKDNQLILYQNIMSFSEGLELLSSGKVLRSSG